MIERSPCGSGGCMTCPFSDNDEAYLVDGYGCLPTRWDIVEMKKKSSHNWSCHSDKSAMCGGFANHIKRRHPELDLKTGGLISYETWYHEGEEVALNEAVNKIEVVK